MQCIYILLVAANWYGVLNFKELDTKQQISAYTYARMPFYFLQQSPSARPVSLSMKVV
jgi:hypothetical protein